MQIICMACHQKLPLLKTCSSNHTGQIWHNGRTDAGYRSTNALEMVLDQPPPLSVVPSSMVPTFSNTISNTGPHYSTTMNTPASKTIIPDNVLESYRLPQAKIALYLNKVKLENLEAQ
jgi:hypothetical protein